MTNQIGSISRELKYSREVSSSYRDEKDKFENERKLLEKEIEQLKSKHWDSERHLNQIVMVYRVAFRVLGIISIAFILSGLIWQFNALVECGEWFVNRWDNILYIISLFKDLFLYILGLTLGLGNIWSYIISIVIFIILFVLVFMLFRFLAIKFIECIKSIKKQYEDGFFKLIITLAVAVCLFLICIFLHPFITQFIPINIFSIWLSLSFASTIIINLKEIHRGLKNYG